VAVEKVEGVREATFSYDRSEGFVTFDTARTSVAEIAAELERLTDFTAIERAGMDHR
jgi:copper chaperone CopZ